MKTKFIFMAAMAALFSMGFTACSNNEDEAAGKEIAQARGIGFNVHADGSHVTRGYATTAANALSTISRFATWAYDDTTDGLYMGEDASTGRVVSYTDTNEDGDPDAWTYTPQQFWPVHPLNFVAITPDNDPEITSKSTASASNVVTLTANVTMSTTVGDQKDIMMAEADDIEKADYSNDVPFSFKHALSQVVFRGKFNDAGAVTKVTIAEISLCNIYQTGVIPFTSTGLFYTEANTDARGQVAAGDLSTPATFTLLAANLEGSVFDVKDVVTEATCGDPAASSVENYTASANKKAVSTEADAIADAKTKTATGTYEYLIGGDTYKSIAVSAPAVLRGTTAFDLTVSNNADKKNAWFMLPQTTVAATGDPVIGTAPLSGSYLKIRAQLEKDGVVILGSAAEDALYIPLAANWDRSKKYIYTIEFNGSNALDPITFSVTAADWATVEVDPALNM